MFPSFLGFQVKTFNKNVGLVLEKNVRACLQVIQRVVTRKRFLYVHSSISLSPSFNNYSVVVTVVVISPHQAVE